MKIPFITNIYFKNIKIHEKLKANTNKAKTKYK
jgi:hypothetical protein